MFLAPNVRIWPQPAVKLRQALAPRATVGCCPDQLTGAHGVAFGSTAAAKAQHPVSPWPGRVGSFFNAALRASKVWISRSTNS